MDVFGDPLVRKVSMMWASRCGKTTVLENAMCYKIDRDSGNILIVLPSDKKAKKWSKVNLRPLIRDNEEIRAKMYDQKSRSEFNEILYKPFEGGILVMGGANVPGSLSSWSMEMVLFDETDEYPPSAEKEGDPIELGMQRAENFPNKKIGLSSTPTIKDASRIEESWNESDQRLFFVPCPHCHAMQPLVFSPRSQFAHYAKGFLKFLHKGNKVTYIAYECGECKKDILPRDKLAMVRQGEWRKLRPEVTDHAGFHINRLYSPWVPWKDVAEHFLRSEKRAERYMVFVNKALGELYVETANITLTEDEFLARREPYEKIPAGVVLLTVGVDVQDDRLEAIVYGWGKEEECWFIEHAVIPGSPEEDLTWTMLDQFILKQRVHENGFPAEYGKIGGIVAVCVDTGDGEHSNTVNAYVAHRKRHRFFAIKGANKPQKDFVIKTRTKKKRNFLILVDTFQGKKKVYYRLNIKQAVDAEGRKIPTAMMMHFNMSCNKEFFDQLTSEQIKLKKIGGRNRQVWELPSGKRNEVLDCTDYALAGLHAIVPGGSKDIDPYLKTLSDKLQFKMQQWEESHPDQASAVSSSKDDQQTEQGETTPTPPATFPKSTKKRISQIRIKI